MLKGKKRNRQSKDAFEAKIRKETQRRKNKKRRECVEKREKFRAKMRRNWKTQQEEVSASLEKTKAPTSKNAQIGLFQKLQQRENAETKEGFVHILRRRARRLFDDSDYTRALGEVYELYAYARTPVHNSLKTWKPKGKSKERLFRSLISHLFLQYKVPLSLYNSFFIPDQTLRRKLIGVMLKIGNGASAKKELKTICPTLTNKMVSCFLQTPAINDPVLAIRSAQILVLGGNPRVVKAFCETAIGRGISSEKVEKFYFDLMQFFCNQPMLNPSIIAPLFDYIQQLRRAQRAKFRMKGRTIDALMRGMEDWHRSLAKETKLHSKVYKPSGYLSKVWELPGPNDWKIFWKVIEIGNSNQLLKEGRRQKHCVASYSHSIESGDCSIWSLRRIHPIDGEEIMLTVEVRNKSNTIVQARGKYNRRATQVEARYLYQWATDNGLRIASCI